MEKPQILWVARSCTLPQDGVKNHMHPFYHMIYVVSGVLRFVIEGKTYLLSPGQCVLIPRNTNHGYSNDEKEPAIYLEIKFSLLKSAFDKQISRRSIQVSDSQLVGALFEQILEEYSTYDSRADSAAASYLLAILNILGENERYKSKEQFRFFAASDYSQLSQKIIKYLEDHYHEDVSLDSLAKEMNRNKSHLCVAFKKDTQMTILDCLNTIRIRRAAELVVYSEYNLAQVARECGFASVSHFNRVFLKYVGITPGQCRRAYPPDILITQGEAASITNHFLYSVLAQKMFSPQTVRELNSLENKTKDSPQSKGME